jgi:hypothetical protein
MGGGVKESGGRQGCSFLIVIPDRRWVVVSVILAIFVQKKAMPSGGVKYLFTLYKKVVYLYKYIFMMGIYVIPTNFGRTGTGTIQRI